MSDFVITPAGGSAVTFAAFADRCLYAAGKYWRTRPHAKTPRYAIETVKAPSTAGQAVKRQDFSDALIDNIEVHYVSTTEALVLSAFVTDRAAILNKASVLTLPDYPATLPACECGDFEVVPSARGHIVRAVGDGVNFWLVAAMKFTQYRLT